MDDMQAQGLTNTSPKAQPAAPKQQAQFDLLLGRCRQLMEKSAQEWLATLQKSPVDGAVTLGTETLRSLAQQSEQAGQPVDPVVLINVGVQFCKDIAAVANSAGLVPDDQLPQFLKDTMSQSIAAYLHADAQDGLLSPEDKQRAQQVLGGAEPASAEPQGMLARMQQGGAQ